MIKSLIKKLLPSFVISWYHFLLAFFGALIYGFPSRRLKVIGVTGTNGKTTVVNMTAACLEAGGYKVASLSSIKFKIGEKEKPNLLKMTMPGRFKIQKFLKQAAVAGCQYAVLEVSSEGIKQHRHKFINFTVAVFTNLSPEHIESHGGFENYKKAKGKLFEAVKKIHVVNVDDKNAEYFLKFPAEKKYLYTNKDDRGSTSVINDEGSTSVIAGRDVDLKLQMLGEFNVYNALAAIAVGSSQGIPPETCKKAVEGIKGLPGRMEIVIREPFKVVVDYAVTPDALEGLYKTLKKEFSPEKLICVFGSCGGGRDKWRRPVLGEIAERYCDKIVLTNEDPYDENPEKIVEGISKGIKKEHERMLDRGRAIGRALELASPRDVVAVTGKGCEPQMAVAGGKKIPWDDREVVREQFEKLGQ
jgi:UDP-N-acetylmuramoyl-L-alanyl-D-glutamate--2,6-diaminopimelate ligase